MNKDGNVRLTDLIPVETLQKIQISFSKMARMAALTTDENGIPLTKGSNFSDLCTNFCRKSPIGRKRCEKCDRDGAMRVLETGRPVSYFCHANLVDFAAPIMLGDRMIGTLVGGQVLSAEPDYDKMRDIARELELDEDGFVDAARRTQIVPEAAIERSTNFIYEFSLVISEMAYKTYETIRLSNLAVSQKSDFLANMSHEIRTPMNAVLGMAEMALREEMTPQAKQYIRQIRSSGKHLLVIINDILDFSKIESGKLDIVKAEYEPLSMVNDLVNIVNTRIGTKKLEFTTDFDPGIPHKLYGDSVRIHQILLNLLNNAVKFTEHGEVHLALSYENADDDQIILKAVIRDTGIGIKQDDMDKIFQSFQQVDSKRNRNIEGTGLGLAIAKQLLKLMDGSIRVQSEYNKGSTFCVELPQKVVSRVPSVPRAESGVNVALLVENRYIRGQLCRDLRSLGVDYSDISDTRDVSNVKSGFLIVEKSLFSESVREAVEASPDLQCLVVAAYNDHFDNDVPRVRAIPKPVFSMGLYSALHGGFHVPAEDGPETDDFAFIAPDAHVLIVDDNPINLNVASGIIEPLKMHVDTANGASQTIEKVRKTKYDMIFMDHMMPEVDGVETTHIIRRLINGYEDVPIIALTANAMGGTREMFLREGMNDFIAKPIEVNEIVAMVRKWLPKEKIVPVEKNSRQEPETSVPVIKGIDSKRAITLLGSEKLYMQVLKDYFNAVDKRAEMIAHMLENGDIRNYTIEVHSLKSTSRQIGADDLADLAARLEKAGGENDVEFIVANTDELLNRYHECKKLIQPLFAEAPDAARAVEEDYGAVSELLSRASAALGDEQATGGILKEMSECRLTPAQKQCFGKFRTATSSGDGAASALILGMWRDIAAAEAGRSFSTAEEIRAALDKMQDALDEFDSLLIDDALEEMSGLTLPGEQSGMFQKMKAAAEDSDIDLCASLVEEWQNMIGD